MKKEYVDIREIFQKPIFNSGNTSCIYRDGDYILKIYNPFYVCRAWHIARWWKSTIHVGICEVLGKRNALTVMLGLKEA